MIKFSLSLSKLGQSAEVRRKIVEFLAERGCKETGTGYVTLSFAADPEAFDEVFQSATRNLSDPLPRAPETIGASAPSEEPEIKIPEELEAYVNQVSVTPPARRFHSNN